MWTDLDETVTTFQSQYLKISSVDGNKGIYSALRGVKDDAVSHGMQYSANITLGTTGDVLIPAPEGIGFFYQNSAMTLYNSVRFEGAPPSGPKTYRVATTSWLLSSLNSDYSKAELTFMMLRWFGKPEARAEVRVTETDIWLSDDHPIIGNNYQVRANVSNVAGSTAFVLVRFWENSLQIGADSIAILPGERAIAETNWMPVFVGLRNITVQVDPINELPEVFDWFNNNATKIVEVFISKIFKEDSTPGSSPTHLLSIESSVHPGVSFETTDEVGQFTDEQYILTGNISINSVGIYINGSYNNTIKNNSVSNTELGICLESSDYNLIYHNNFIGNLIQAYDDKANFWDNGYPSGGNYWSDYSGVDLMSGPLQDQPGSDGIGDTPYEIDANSTDHYPLMSPFVYLELNIPLQQGWNLISLPVRQLNWSIDSVLESIAGKWDCIQTYDSLTGTWLSNNRHRPSQLNDLSAMNHLKGYWINITEPGVILMVKGDKFGSPLSIPLCAGWNLVGYPTLNTTTTVANALWGTGADRVEVCDPTDPYRTKEVSSIYVMKPGQGYWVHVPADTTWLVNW
jgi:parallel beta-helix repeat protein